MSEQEPFETRRSISRHLTEEGALPICEQCNSSGNSKPVEIVSETANRSALGPARHGLTSHSANGIVAGCIFARNAFGRSNAQSTVE